MFKDKFVLRKNSWHSKLMQFTWNLKPRDFSHMCPYFWLSFFNLLIFPIMFTFKYLLWNICKGIVKLGVKAIEKFDAYLTARALEWDRKHYEELKSREEGSSFFQTLVTVDLDSKFNKKISTFLNKLQYTDPDMYRKVWEVRYIKTAEERQREEALEKEKRLKARAARERQEQREREWEEKRQARLAAMALKPKKAPREYAAQKVLTNKEFINAILKKIMPVMKFLFWTIASCVIVAALFGVYKVGSWLVGIFADVPKSDYQTAGKYILWGIGIAAGLFFFGFLIHGLYKEVLCKIKIRRIKTPFFIVQTKIFFRFVWKWICHFFNFIYDNTIHRVVLKIARSGPMFRKIVQIITYPFVMIGKGIVWFCKGIKLLFFVIVRTAKNECPAIEWED